MTTGRGFEIVVRDELTAADRASVGVLAHESASVDGANPLDDQVRLDLAAPASDTHLHVLATAADGAASGTANEPASQPGRAGLLGYAHVDFRGGDSTSAHLVVDPASRRQGVGTALVDAVVTAAGSRGISQVRAWSHGDVPAAAALASKLNWTRTRELRQMLLPRTTPIAAATYPNDVTVRTFVVGEDEPAWLAVNAAAFHDHPEQGHITLDDLRQREDQPWFDPSGFFLAERDGTLLGFHWTKVHAGEGSGEGSGEDRGKDPGDDPGDASTDGKAGNAGNAIGEVYVVGVHPDAQGLGLGKALTLTGLAHLRKSGLDVMLYVDADNAAAVAVYEKLGFTTVNVDVMYDRPAAPAAPTSAAMPTTAAP